MLNEFIDYSKEVLNSYLHGESPKKKILGEVFSEVSDTLMKASIDLESNKFPVDCCLKMSELTNFILKEFKTCKKDKYIIKLHTMLNNCNKIKNKYENNEIDSVICDLRKASTEFKALSFAIRV
jgi:hypothetical protein